MDATQISQRPRSLIIPLFKEEFCEILQERLQASLDFHFELDGKFTLFLNIISRENTKKLREKRMIYGGLKTQRQWLDDHFFIRDKPNSINKSWIFLDEHEFIANEGIAGGPLFSQFENGNLSINDIKPNILSDYFSSFLRNGKFNNEIQSAEYPILNTYFSIERDSYISLPLIQFGFVDGLIHIVFEDDEGAVSKILGSRNSIKTIIKIFSEKYESLLLDWDLVDMNAEKSSWIENELRHLTTEENWQEMKLNPIFVELNLYDYYKASAQYFRKRVQTTNLIPSLIIEQRRRNAIMSILIDSYAHNISAHSLTALTWLFRQRAEKIRSFEHNLLTNSEDQINVSPLVYAIRDFSGEIHPLFRFLLDKGAFWSGLTRERHFGGQILNMFDLLFDFANNPLYLGTIAFSEGILKVNINVNVYRDTNPYDKSLKRIKAIKRNQKGELLHGNLIRIDLTQLFDLNKSTEDNELSEFVTYGEAFDKLMPELSEYEVFLPGGVIGRHALFTLLENEIRNVKHYSKRAIEVMRNDGVTLGISIEEESLAEFDEKNHNYDDELFKLGIWLNHPVNLTKSLVFEKLNRLEADIIDENYNPRLGGNYQDKVCAALLFNNTFISVQNKSSIRDERFYPWVKSGSASIREEEGEFIEDYEISLRNMRGLEFEDSPNHFKFNYNNHSGYLKKYIHLWKGKNIYKVNTTEKLSDRWENPSRFRFVFLESMNDENVASARDAGIIRIIEEKTDDLATAYKYWFNTWFDNLRDSRLTFRVKGQNAANLIYDEDGIQFLNRDEINELDQSTRKNYQSYPEHEINLAHGNQQALRSDKDTCRFRSHGVLKQHFCDGLDLDEAKVASEYAAEIFEVLMSRVCIFDNRIANRVEKANQSMLKDQLNCFIYKENTDEWHSLKHSGFDKFHFLVVHLSFIEAFRDDTGHKLYSEQNVGDFIEKEIDGSKGIGANFILVITTGRGRTQWWNRLENSDQYAQFLRFTTFRPVESIIAGIEYAISRKDDFELKYRLMKVLFGS